MFTFYNDEIAKKIGIEAAVVIHFLADIFFLADKRYLNVKTKIYDNNLYIESPHELIRYRFRYFNTNKINWILTKLVDNNILTKRKFKDEKDNRYWYARKIGEGK